MKTTVLLTDNEVRRLNERLSEPYEIPEHCPYLSEEQRELRPVTL
jgi:hypothetical protein